MKAVFLDRDGVINELIYYPEQGIIDFPLLLGRMKCELCRLMDEEDARPDAIVSNLNEATDYIFKIGG